MLSTFDELNEFGEFNELSELDEFGELGELENSKNSINSMNSMNSKNSNYWGALYTFLWGTQTNRRMTAIPPRSSSLTLIYLA